MKRIAAFLVLLLAAGSLTLRAQQSADSQYLDLYGAIQQADGLASTGNFNQALAKYTGSQAQLQQFQKAFPDWNPKIVTFRLKYIAGKIADLQSSLSAPALPTTNATTAAPVVPNVGENPELVSLRQQVAALQNENATLLAKLKEALTVQPAQADAGELASAQNQVRSLMKENDLLKAGAAGIHGATSADSNALAQAQIDALAQDNSAMKNQLAALQSDAKVRQLENTTLENRLQELQRAGANSAVPLIVPGPAANQQPQGSKKKATTTELEKLADQNRILRERLAVAEARPVPYTPEELALLSHTAPQPVATPSRKKSVKELPAGSAALVAEAQGFFAAKQYDRAEANYLKILEQDPGNALTLGNLAAIEMQEGKLDEAEKHITAAVAQDPDDAFNLSTLGYLKFRQEKFDEALDILSRALKLDPQNPEILNYLGVTLSHKGQRAEAENMLRQAIELNPGYAAAHNNLAAIYISATPPRAELARWHYQKALDAGQPHNLELEKALDASGKPSAP